MILIRRFYTGKYVFVFLVWNLFLAWIPLVSALILNIVGFSESRALKIILFPILLILWVIFFPNAPYMITDFIHFKNNGTFLIWYDLVIYAIFIWTGFFLGFVSLHLVKITIDRVVNRIVSWTMVVGVLFLSSYAIYIGRFIRHNSWEAVFNPFGIFLSFIKNLSIQSLVFSSIFSALLFLTYAFLYALTYLRDEKIPDK